MKRQTSLILAIALMFALTLPSEAGEKFSPVCGAESAARLAVASGQGGILRRIRKPAQMSPQAKATFTSPFPACQMAWVTQCGE